MILINKVIFAFLEVYFCAFEFIELAVKPVGIVPYLIKGHFYATRSHLIYIVKGSETYDVKGPTSIIQKVTTAMFGDRALNGPVCSETWFVGG